jgi:hypothetical protein
VGTGAQAISVVADDGYHARMSDPQTTSVALLVERLRERRPGASDRELIESATRIHRGRQAVERIGERFVGVPVEEIEREAVKAVREVRRERQSAPPRHPP